MRPANGVITFFTAAGSIVLMVGRPSGWEHGATTLAALALAPFLLEGIERRFPSRAAYLVGGLYPCLAIPVGYFQLAPICQLLHPALADARLQEIDQFLFHVQPSVWLAPHMAPWMNDILMACYASYYFWPLLVGLVYLRQGKDREFERWATVVALAAMLNYAFYILVPAEGPRFMLAGAFAAPVQGRLIAGRLWEALRHSPFLYDCFPSGHTTLTLLVLIETFRRQRRTFWVALPIASGLIAATVACRFHYGIDLLAALPLVVLVLAVTDPVVRASPSRWFNLRSLVRTAP
ncbi:MAG: phosphatase PAP2 family protein [Myxococcales bacterium]